MADLLGEICRAGVYCVRSFGRGRYYVGFPRVCWVGFTGLVGKVCLAGCSFLMGLCWEGFAGSS